MSTMQTPTNSYEGKLCPALEQLKEEHISIREKMNLFHDFAKSIDSNSNEGNYNSLLIELQGKVIDFTDELEPHSIREENVLFPLMAEHIGKNTGPIVVMEYEHEQAKKNLNSFMDSMKKSNLIVDYNEAKTKIAFLNDAYTILTDHFMKEELVLFPMAEQMLSAQEKEQLTLQIKEIV
ncbi:hemerythrin domain-containing protein [Paenisporosarcina antarctica]|uniref:Hemerythrin domain-containing protein n=2 Tax=Paenisporosarcina antarctica TaxID=417367 RepID=A0A4P7A229_9BACL|nr:hemerythrin domain-containing protein [Paenisporosarcina antarctica]